MNKLIDAALGIHPQALTLAARRLELLAGNMANADTPGFKARDVDFRATLEKALQASNEHSATLRTTRARHVSADQTPASSDALYRVPTTPSLDGNTVDTQLEQVAFAEAAVRYQASLDFIDRRISGLRQALRGE